MLKWYKNWRAKKNEEEIKLKQDFDFETRF